MALTVCPECEGKVSDKAFACPACGYPMAQGKGTSQWPRVLGGVAGTYISAQALVTIIVGSVMFLAFAAIMIAAIVRG
ncbi:hypothetical protein [Agrobacterium larrymoorei]|uniref:hypothetical protein n=1 Tax=Agrobacterium larrymoorei TaxID=160699 RepID=UPI0030BE1B44